MDHEYLKIYYLFFFWERFKLHARKRVFTRKKNWSKTNEILQIHAKWCTFLESTDTIFLNLYVRWSKTTILQRGHPDNGWRYSTLHLLLHSQPIFMTRKSVGHSSMTISDLLSQYFTSSRKLNTNTLHKSSIFGIVHSSTFSNDT